MTSFLGIPKRHRRAAVAAAVFGIALCAGLAIWAGARRRSHQSVAATAVPRRVVIARTPAASARLARPASLAAEVGERDAASADARAGARRLFSSSIVAPAAARGVTIVRTALTPAELGQSMSFVISLAIRNRADLDARIAAREKVSRDELQADYLPSASDYASVVDWLKSQGFAITGSDPNHAEVFASGTVSQIQDALQATFARVETADGEFTSAVTAPSLPESIADAVSGIVGLQPYHLLHRTSLLRPDVYTYKGYTFLVPPDLISAYNVPASLSINSKTISVTGTGQTIAVIMDGTVNTSDLTTFWTTICGSSQTMANFTAVPINGGPTTSGTSGNEEATLDVEWAGGAAPGAKVRLYEIPDLSDRNILAACTQILSDAQAYNITVASLSGAAPESDYNGNTPALHTSFALLAASGITVFAASGDGGSRPVINSSATGEYYDPSSPLGAEYPASDPDVTGVGGTTLSLTSSYAYSSETAWFETAGTTQVGTGGGYSALFSRPSWQADGNSLLAGSTWRCVPDVSAMAEANISASQYVLLFITESGQQKVIGVYGTSVACPVWAGLAADIDQARAAASLGSLGVLGPNVYPLHASGFRDITTGTNGTDGKYAAGTGYDLCTGLGTPNVTNLIDALAFVAPTIALQPQSTTTTVGSSFSLSVTAAGTAPLSYQWYVGTTAISGATSSSYSVSSAATSNAGSYTVVVSNPAGSVTSSAATVTVNPAPTPPSSGGGGGGGGAPSLWFYSVLAAIVAARLAVRGRQAVR